MVMEISSLHLADDEWIYHGRRDNQAHISQISNAIWQLRRPLKQVKFVSELYGRQTNGVSQAEVSEPEDLGRKSVKTEIEEV